MNLREQTGPEKILASRTNLPRPGVVEIHRAPEPLRRDWTLAEELFRQDRETLRSRDIIGCSALEMAESMDRFLNPIARS